MSESLVEWATDDIAAMARYTVGCLAAADTPESREQFRAAAADYLDELARRAGARKGTQQWTRRRA